MQVKIGVVLLDQLDRYIVNGKLPSRPDFDKEFLLNLVKNKKCIASDNTMQDLPPSIFNSVDSINAVEVTDYDVNLGIKTFKEYPPDIFFVSRTPKYEPVQFRSIHDKYFDISWLNTNYNIVISHYNLEIWLKK